jgi:hypothetical protein
MIVHMARRLSRSAFALGCCIGLMFAGPYVTATQAAPSRTLANPPECTIPPGTPADVAAYINLQCAIHAAIFADNTTPNHAFKFTSPITAPGTYTGLDRLSRAVTFAAVHVVNCDVKTYDPALYTQGVEVSIVFGTLTGPAGSERIEGMVLLPTGITQDTGYLLMPVGIPTVADLDQVAVATRILAGPRVTNVVTGDSTPLSEATGVLSLWGSSTDLSTLFCGCMQGLGPPPGGGVDLDCVKRAYDAYNNSMKLANDIMQACVLNVVRNFAICMAARIRDLHSRVGLGHRCARLPRV